MLSKFESKKFNTKTQTICYEFREGYGHPIIFFHATGFNKAVWYPVVEKLKNPIYLIDMPGHGKSDYPEREFYWDKTAIFLSSFINFLDLKDVIGVGHSMGGQLMLSVAAIQPDFFQRLILLDPVVLPIEHIKFLQSIQDSPIARRRNDWSSADELYEVYKERPPFNTWNDSVLRNYASQALKPIVGTKRFQLACNPLLEASVYKNLGSEDLLERLSDIQTPVHIIRARDKMAKENPLSFNFSPTWKALPNKLPNSNDEQLKEWSHFFPMEYPEWVAAKVVTITRDKQYSA